ncbi:recombinase RecT [Aliidiomarina quisquiliarum]|uniref:recombinase RecT n=1 Tax=Aliidiomarina quisquiliarum TaxID=2938947 RepID=UPI00208F80D5|nr:recombinase RecT [Aliidiomarina quisquiliarum]MCO4319957.1 recombinase RecT [Aliidiomarina quisquiliarum]
MNQQQPEPINLKQVFEDKDLPNAILDAYRKGNPSKSYTLEMCQRAVLECYRACAIEARRARSFGMVGLYDVEPLALRGALFDIAAEGLSLLPQSRHFFFSVYLPDYATMPVLQVVLKKRGIQHLIFGRDSCEDFTLQLVHKGDTFVWKGQSIEPIYESNPDNMRNPLVCAWCMYKENGKKARYYLLDAEPVEIKAIERREADPSMNNPWVRFPRITKEAEILRMFFNVLNPIHNFTIDSSSEDPRITADAANSDTQALID